MNNQQNQPSQSNISKQTQSSIPSEMPRKPNLPNWASILIIVVAAIIVVGLVGYGAYRYFVPQPEPAELPTTGQEEPTPSPLPIAEPAEEPADQTAEEQIIEDKCDFVDGCEIFESEKFGIRFKYRKGHKYGPSIIEERNNEIISLLPSHESYLEDCEENELCKIINNKPYSPDAGSIMIFSKLEDETIEEAIQNIIEQEGKNPDDCKIVEIETVSKELKTLKIDSAELIVEVGLQQEKLNNLCSMYAKGEGLFTLRIFLYDENKSKTKSSK